jgi:hypothetical protein|uniref:Uncharacterized protein n=1 Tax=Eutreptiella gymnastica TaxID=73025 RepID=A0A7S4GAS3_9EUGL|mmetsp:Transcript_80301/g.134384  ORF Transcript_80301/g.134384 Transcript_80301/m.134384 type:complete len:565 (-) Transcript_80301:765-2459(-)
MAQVMFEPTGDLEKDYLAYCEIQDCVERDEILNAICDNKTTDLQDTHKGLTKIRLFVRSLEWCLHSKDMAPLASAIPFCYTLNTVRFSSAGMTNISYKLLIQAVWKSTSIVSVWVDFNKYTEGLFADPYTPSVAHKETSDGSREMQPGVYYLVPAEAASGGYASPMGDADAEAKKAAAAAQAKGAAKPAPGGGKKGGKGPSDEAGSDPRPVPIPDGFHAMLMTHIQELSLRGNHIDDDQVALFAAGLTEHRDLLSLNLWGNCITDVGAKKLAEVLRINRKLTALNLGDNHIGDEGAQALAKCFKSMLVDTDMLQEARQKVRGFHAQYMSDELPAYPTYEELDRQKSADALVAPAKGGKDEKGKKGKEEKPKGGAKKGGVGEPGQRVPAYWDCDVFKMTGNLYIIPGNQSLWSLNLSNNKQMTDQAVDAFCSLFDPTQYHIEDAVGFQPVVPEVVDPEEAEAEAHADPKDAKVKAKSPPGAGGGKKGGKEGKGAAAKAEDDGGAGSSGLNEIPLAEWPLHGVGETGCPGCTIERICLANADISPEALKKLETLFTIWKADRPSAN